MLIIMEQKLNYRMMPNIFFDDFDTWMVVKHFKTLDRKIRAHLDIQHYCFNFNLKITDTIHVLKRLIGKGNAFVIPEQMPFCAKPRQDCFLFSILVRARMIIFDLHCLIIPMRAKVIFLKENKLGFIVL